MGIYLQFVMLMTLWFKLLVCFTWLHFHLFCCFGGGDLAGVVELCTGEEEVSFGPKSAGIISPDLTGIFSFSLSLLLVLFLGCSEYCDILPFGITSGLKGSSLLLFFLKGSELLLLCLDLWTLSDDWVSESLCRLDLLLLLCFNLPPLCTVSHPSVSWSAKLIKKVSLPSNYLTWNIKVSKTVLKP